MLRCRREEEKEERWAANLQPAWAQEPKNLMRVICESYINDGRLNYYTS